MADYSKTTNFSAKDSLATGNSNKIVKGSEIDTEFNAIATSIATKVDEVTVASTKLLTGNGSGGFQDSGITASDVSDLITNGSVPVGTVMMWSGGAAPTGFLLCDGSSLNSVTNTEYAALFAVIGTTFGGTGNTDFDVPNMVDRMPICAGNTYSNGNTGGAATHTLTTSEIPSHRHQEYHTGTDGDWGAPGNCASFPRMSGAFANCSGTNPYPTNAYTSYVGSGAAHNNLPPYMGIKFIIKY